MVVVQSAWLLAHLPTFPRHGVRPTNRHRSHCSTLDHSLHGLRVSGNQSTRSYARRPGTEAAAGGQRPLWRATAPHKSDIISFLAFLRRQIASNSTICEQHFSGGDNGGGGPSSIMLVPLCVRVPAHVRPVLFAVLCTILRIMLRTRTIGGGGGGNGDGGGTMFESREQYRRSASKFRAVCGRLRRRRRVLGERTTPTGPRPAAAFVGLSQEYIHIYVVYMRSASVGNSGDGSVSVGSHRRTDGRIEEATAARTTAICCCCAAGVRGGGGTTRSHVGRDGARNQTGFWSEWVALFQPCACVCQRERACVSGMN